MSSYFVSTIWHYWCYLSFLLTPQVGENENEWKQLLNFVFLVTSLLTLICRQRTNWAIPALHCLSADVAKNSQYQREYTAHCTYLMSYSNPLLCYPLIQFNTFNSILLNKLSFSFLVPSNVVQIQFSDCQICFLFDSSNLFRFNLSGIKLCPKFWMKHGNIK